MSVRDTLLALALVASAAPAWAAGVLDQALPDDARDPVRTTLEQLGETDAAAIAAGATGIVATDPATAAPRVEGYGDAQSPEPNLAIVRIHSAKYCNGDRCLTFVGAMSSQRMSVCAAFAAGPDVETTGMVGDVLGATARGFGFPGPDGKLVVMVRPGLCLVIPPTTGGRAADAGGGQEAPAAPRAPAPAPGRVTTDEADGTRQ